MVLSDLMLGIVAGAAIGSLLSYAVAAQGIPPAGSQSRATMALVPPGVGMLDQPCPVAQLPQSDRMTTATFFANAAYQKQYDWAWLCRFRAENARIATGAAPSVVFMGDSITENWGRSDPALFSHGILDRGISGQTSPQMLLRFYQDVVALHPRAVHIMAGTNDIAGNTGPTSPDQFRNNIMAMVTLAQANHIRVILASIPPAVWFHFQPSLKPALRIAELNAWLKTYAIAAGAIYADYYAVLAEPDGRIKDRYSADGVHPNALGYQAMRPVTEAAIARALRAPR